MSANDASLATALQLSSRRKNKRFILDIKWENDEYKIPFS